MNKHMTESKRSNTYLNGALTAVAALLALNFFQGTVGLPSMAEASAQRGSVVHEGAAGIANPADDRRDMIREIHQVNEKLDALIQALGKRPIEVAVVSMPKGSNTGGGKESGGGNAGNTGSGNSGGKE